MPNRLEQYVDDLNANLSGLSPEQRAAELSEVRAHLGALVDSHCELGLDVDAAEAAAIRQFGAPQNVSQGVHLAALQRLLDNPLGAAATLIVLNAAFHAAQSLLFPIVWAFGAAQGYSAQDQLTLWARTSDVSSQILVPAVSGYLAARWLPHAAVRGAFLVTLLAVPTTLSTLLVQMTMNPRFYGHAFWLLVPLVSVVSAGATLAVQRRQIA